MNEILNIAFLTGLLAGMIRLASPILITALGELVAERSGILNLGVEGIMLIGAFTAFVASYHTGTLWWSFVLAIMAGGTMGLFMAFMSSTLKINQTVTGLTINLFTWGLTFYIYRIVFIDFSGKNLPNIETFKPLFIPIIHKIPILGEALFQQSPLTYLTFLLIPLISLFLYKTKTGLELRCVGENPQAMDMKGLNITLFQYAAVIFGGMMAGAGGAFLTLVSAGYFLPDIVAGRGWIAIAIVVFGDWKPYRLMIGALIFGLLDAFQLQAQGIGIDFPYQILVALPYIFTILALVISRNRAGAPLNLGEPYIRE